MAEARQRDEWDRTALLICRIVNAIPFRGATQALQISDVHPFESRRGRGLPLRMDDLKRTLERHRRS